jgi:hypothetical protein
MQWFCARGLLWPTLPNWAVLQVGGYLRFAFIMVSIQLAALGERFHVCSACMNLVRRLSLSAARAASSGSIELSKNKV